jgi:threonylcarbamoyladenosine tRNA methylthiotransferase MtaB
VTDKRELPDLLGRMGVVDVPDGISDFAGLHRAFVKVQDGCMLRCSFCIIPQVRPHLVSRPPGAIVAEVRRLIAAGFREVVLTGIHLGHYGVDFNRGRPKAQWVRLSHLLERLMRIDEDFRVRLSSIEATEVTRELIDVMAAHPRRICPCPHLHISMQSGSDAVLARMRRRWGRRRLIDRCRLVQDCLERPAMTTDVIVGFPGETEDDFQQTCDACDEIGYSRIHIFPFSPRRGTPAAEMPDQISPAIKSFRVERLKELAERLQARYHDQLVGTHLRILVQSPWPGRRGVMSGTACRYAPVALAVPSNREGKLVDGVARARHGDHLMVAPIANV